MDLKGERTKRQVITIELVCFFPRLLGTQKPPKDIRSRRCWIVKVLDV